jgi:hypothetical protein
LNFEQKERILGLNAIEFFELKNLPQPRALKIARETWQEGEGEMATAKRYEARENV